jgi:uncharacterized protein (DUF2141 family)
MNLNKNLHWFICIIFLTSCARQSSPTGGPKDTIPPEFKHSIPPNEAINYKGKELELLFSEQVILNSPKEQLIITPTIGKEYEISARKNAVIISFEDPLRDSTTYTFNFRESIQDITEKNPVENLQVAFSTGSYIDSLSIEGSVFDLIKGKALKETTVALHVENDTFNIFLHPAIYFTKTDEKGKFKISHLKPDNYFIYAFEDKNRNLIVDTRTESYGFLAEYLYLIENLKDISFGLIHLDARELKMTSARPYNTYFNIRTTKNLRTYELSAVDSSDIVTTFGEDQANIRVYKTTDQDSLQIKLTAIDSIDNRLDTTLYAKYLTREVTPEDFEFSVPTSSIIAEKGVMDIAIQFTKPVKEINFDSLFFKVDSLTTINFSQKDVNYDPQLRRLTIRKNIDKTLFVTEETEKQKNPLRGNTRGSPPKTAGPDAKKQPAFNTFYAGRSAFISVENDSSKRLTQTIKPLREADLSVINIEIKTDEDAFFVELVDNNFKVIKTSRNKRKVRFEDIIPGEYQIRLIIDHNKNGRWDPGNYLKSIEPEKIIYYRGMDGSTVIKGVKANWEIGAGEMFITY